jgi:RHS repeat-associated protein
LGNGVVRNRTYDAVTSWLSTSTAGVGGGAALLNQSYLEDFVGNVTQRQTNNLPVVTESFNYDADNRLNCVLLSSTCPQGTNSIVYDGGAAGPGNITSQTGVGTYTYPAAGQPHPHAVASLTGTFNGITNPTFLYDANGNMTNRASSSANIVWYSFNYPMSIAASDATGSEAVTFNYGPDRQRWKQVYTLTGAPTETTYYVGGLIDVVFVSSTTDYRQYIFAGSEPIAVYSRTAAGVNTMRYMLDDHQGSTSVVATNSGTAAVKESFSAFGTRRDPSTWSGAPSTTDLTTIAGISRQGYTMQTALGQSMGLNHMNGRVEDAILGRMLSPDAHIPDPANAQSYNRYTYVLNNPVTLVDPSGFVECAPNRCFGDHAHGGGYGEANIGSFGWFSANQSDSMSALSNAGYDLAALTAWVVAAANYTFSAGFADSSDSSGVGDSSSGAGIGDTSGAEAGTLATSPGVSAQSQSGGGSTVWGDGCGGTCDVTAGVTVTTAAVHESNGSDTVSSFLNAAGMLVAPVELRYGEFYLGTPNGGLYPHPWANGAGRTVRIGALTKSFGWATLALGTALDYDSLTNGEIDQTQFNVNVGLGAASMLSPAGFLVSPYIYINSSYPGGLGQWMLDNPEARMPIAAGYLGN